MKNSELWRLYNVEEKSFFNDLSLEQLSTFIKKIPTTERDHWHVCKDGDDDWFPLATVYGKLNLTSPSPSSSTGGLSRTDPDVVSLDAYFNTATGVREKHEISGVEKRKVKRLDKRIQVFIDIGDQILTAYTENVSVTAIKLDTKLPLNLARRPHMVTLAVKPALVLRCSPLVSEIDTGKGYYNRLKINPSLNLKDLVTFLEKEATSPRK